MEEQTPRSQLLVTQEQCHGRKKVLVALHEVGHAVVAYHFGRVIKKMGLQLGALRGESPRSALGHVHHYPELARGHQRSDKEVKTLLHQEICIGIAGRVAVESFGGKPFEGLRGSGEDFEHVHVICTALGLGDYETERVPYIQRCAEEVWKVLYRRDKQVLRLTEALLKHTELKAVDIHRIMRGGKP